MGSYQRITIITFLIGCLVGLSVGRGDETVTEMRVITSSTSVTPTSVTSVTPTSVTSDTDDEYNTVTEVGTTFEAMITEESSIVSSQNLTKTFSPGSEDENVTTTQNVTQTVVSTSSKASQVTDAVTTVSTEVGTDVETGTSPLDGDEELMATAPSELTTDGLPVSLDEVETVGTTPVSENSVDEGTTYINITTVVMEEITSATERPVHFVASIPLTLGEDLITLLATTPGFLTTVDQITSAPTSTPKRVTTAVLQTPQPPTTLEDLTTTLLHTSLPGTTERITTTMLHTSLPPSTPDGPTTSAPERATTANLQTSIPPTTSESSTTLLLQTSIPPTTSVSTTTALSHTLPPTTPEGSTMAPIQTSIQPSTSGSTTAAKLQTTLPPATPGQSSTATATQASTSSLSTSHGTQITDADHEDSHLNQISVTDLSSNEIENIATLQLTEITEESWYRKYDLKFREYVAGILNSVSSSDGIYYIRPTPLYDNDSGTLYVSFIARSSSERKRSTNPVVPQDDVLGAFNVTGLIAKLNISRSQVLNITGELPGFIEDMLPTSTTLPEDNDDEATEATDDDEATEATDDDEATEDPTRKPPPDIGFMSNPGLFISLVVIATVSIIIIIVGLIYLLCDRKRGRSGEYITNHTPRNSDLELGFDNPVMAENDKNVSNGNHLSSIKGDMESDMIVPYDNFTQEELMNYEVEDTHL